MANPLSCTTADCGSTDDAPFDGPSETRIATMDVLCGDDDMPDTDDGMFITKAAFQALASRASSNSPAHCSSCTCAV